MPDSGTAVQAVGTVIAVLFGLVVYVWSALALSGVFGKVGERQWQAWVPAWNAAVLLRIGGYSPWLVLLVLVPFVGPPAALVVFVMACHRITVGFGYGGGMTVAAAVATPIWASVLAWGGANWSGRARPRPVSLPPGQPGPPPDPPGRESIRSGSLAQVPAESAPVPSGSAAASGPAPKWRPVTSISPRAEDDPSPVTNPAVGAGTDEEPLEPGWVGSALSPADPAAPLSISDWHTDTQIPVFVPPPVEPPAPPDRPVRAVGMPPPQPPVPAPGGPPARDPIAGLRWAPPPDVFRPAPPATAPRVPGAEEPFGRPGEPEPVADPGSAAPFEEPDDRTMPASRLRPGWTLITSADLEIALTGTEVLLGRQPGTDPNHPAAQPLVLPDPTRTVSKVHALLRLVDGVWLVRDLGSTNGITLVAADGRERTLARDLEAPVTGRFFLGDAEFELREGPPHP